VSKQTCEACRFQLSGACHRYPEAFPVAPDHWCGEFKDASAAFNSAPEKFPDSDLIDAIRYNGQGFVTWRDGMDDLAIKFRVSRRAVEERVKRLSRLQKLEIERGGNGRRLSVAIHPSVQDWAWWEKHCAEKGISPKVRWKTLEETGQIPEGGTKQIRPGVKWSFDEHLLPSLVALAPDKDNAAKYSRLAEVSESTFKINRASFDRLIKNAVAEKKVCRTESGEYHLP
jgi:hypothetical protein